MRYGAHVDSFGLTILNLDPDHPEGQQHIFLKSWEANFIKFCWANSCLFARYHSHHFSPPGLQVRIGDSDEAEWADAS